MDQALEKVPNAKPLQKYPAVSGSCNDINESAMDVSLVSSQSSPGVTKPAMGRHIVRQRDIRYKKMATVDSKALNEACKISENVL